MQLSSTVNIYDVIVGMIFESFTVHVYLWSIQIFSVLVGINKSVLKTKMKYSQLQKSIKKKLKMIKVSIYM